MEIVGENSSWGGLSDLGREAQGRSGRRLREGDSPLLSGRPTGAGVSADSWRSKDDQPLLSEILMMVGQSAPFQVPMGTDEVGDAIWLDLHHRESRHLLIEGGTSAARGEMLRALVIGLAMTTRPALLQILAIDLSGRELSVVDAVPHAVAETATDPAAARMNLAWLGAELEARTREGRLWPEMLLVIEDVLSLTSSSGRGRAGLTAILRSGGAWGVHVIGGVSAWSGGLKSAGWSGPDVARLAAGERPGGFELMRGRRKMSMRGARVSARELDQVARGGRPVEASAARRLGAHAGRAGRRRIA